jgi:transposase-like protein
MIEQGREYSERPAGMTATQSALSAQSERRCPWCGSTETRLVHRGYAGPTDEVNQYFTCQHCGKVTYELVAKTAREMRLGRFRAGGIYKDTANQTRYHVSRVLKVGLNEYLIYLKPIIGPEPAVAGA